MSAEALVGPFVAEFKRSMANALVGTGISPALSSISAYFADAPQALIQMMVSQPSQMVLLVSAIYSPLTNRMSMRNICVLGLGLFTLGGMWAILPALVGECASFPMFLEFPVCGTAGSIFRMLP